MIWGRGRALRPVLVGSVVAAKSVLVGSYGLLALVLLGLKCLLLLRHVGLGRLQRSNLARVPLLVARHPHADDAGVHVGVVATAQLGALAGEDDLLLTF